MEFHVKEAPDTVYVFYSIFIIPCHYHFISNVLVNASFILKDGISNVGKKIFKERMVGFVTQLLSNCSGRIKVKEHENSFLFFGAIILPTNDVPEVCLPKLTVYLKK